MADVAKAVSEAPKGSALSGMDPKKAEAIYSEYERLKAKEAKVAERTRKYGERTRAYNTLMIQKARAKGIEVTEAEVERFLAGKK